MKIRILQIIGAMNRGGAETFLMNVLREIDSSKFELLFLCYGDKTFDYEDEIYALGGKIIRTPDVKEVGVVDHIIRIRRIILENDIDILHAHTYFNSMFSLIAARLAGVRVRITHSHNTKSEEHPSSIKKAYFIISRAVVNGLSTVRLACGKEAGRALFSTNSKFTVIYNGIDLARFAYDNKKRLSIRKDLGIKSSTKVILHVGRFEEQKNHTFLIEVFKEYRAVEPNSKLLLVGRGVLSERIKQKVERLGLQDAVLFLGVRPDTDRLYCAADVFVFPSLFEGLPVVLIEAQANGLPILASNTIDKAVGVSTRAIEFMSLEQTAQEWAQKVYQVDTVRNKDGIVQGGQYDIRNVVEMLQELYATHVAKL